MWLKKEGVVYSYEHPYIEERRAVLGQVADPKERARLLREIGEHKCSEFSEMPMLWPHADAIVNPKSIAEYAFPGSINGCFTHLEYVKLVR